jgi:hypothetical protein
LKKKERNAIKENNQEIRQRKTNISVDTKRDDGE